ncbi:hypothetical protein [uncultured Oscillibacter sp.]|uniref:hypothetical protein n=1 Tax=uncultured Oscillibacter sp. TaxID=876091 RepID=UPI00261DB738|nr:hypothetical protein [uncultured Oscillibacter sp.]
MKGKRLLKALGQVDADYIEEASPTQQAKRPGWLKWGAIAACLVLVCAAIAHFSPANQDEDKQGVADAAPMVYVNDTLYIQSSNQKGYPEQEDGFVYLGKILSDVTNYQGDGADGIPKENFQANDPIIGCEVYQYGENIVVKINSSYWLYMKYGEPEITWDDLTEQEKADLDPTYKG